MTPLDVAIVGGGVAGLVAALELSARGIASTVYDARRSEGCSLKAGGMLAPLSELDLADPEIARLGLDAPVRWEAILGPPAQGDLWNRQGSLLLAHRPEWPLLTQLLQRARASGLASALRDVDAEEIAALEPWTDGRIRRGLFIPAEGVVHPEATLPALRRLAEARGIVMRDGVEVEELAPYRIRVSGTSHACAAVLDCRGLGARHEQPLRGVRGEFMVLRSAHVRLGRPVRLMHPRYPLYVIPRPDGRIYVGATQLESEDPGAAHVRSALELLSALYSLDPGFADASIERFGVGLRPAYVDNHPRVVVEPGLVRLNGLFRHGWLLAPRLSQWAADAIEGRPPDEDARPYWHAADAAAPV